MLSLRHQGSTDPFYAPARDVAYLYPAACQVVAAMLEDGRDAAIRQWCEQCGVTVDDLGKAMGAYCRFLNLAHQRPEETIEGALERAGWFKESRAAQFAILYYVGTAMSATFFEGVRDVVRLGGSPLDSVQHLMWAAKRVLLYSRMSRWQRFCYRWFGPWRRFLWRKFKIARRKGSPK